MSTDFSKVQTPICDITPGEAAETVEYCPTCIIDPNAVVPSSWWLETEPYLNKKTCEYYIPVSLNAEGKTYTTKELKKIKIPFNAFKYSYIRPAIRLALRHFEKINDDNVVCAKIPKSELGSITPPRSFGKSKPHLYDDRNLWSHLGNLYEENFFTDSNGAKFKVQEVNEKAISRFEDITNPEALELFTRVDDYHLGNGLEPIKMLVVIPAYVFDQIPDNPLKSSRDPAEKEDSDENEEKKDQEYDLKSEVVIDPYTFKKDIKTLSTAFQSWGKFQAIFYKTQGGRLKQTSFLDKDKKINFYIRKYKRPMEIFADQLETLITKNGMKLSPKDKKRKQKKSLNVVDKIKITFSQPTGNKTYGIEKVECKTKDCPYKEMTRGAKDFFDAPQTQEPTILNYVAKLPESVMVMNVMKSAPWIDWAQQYTYPPVEVKMMNAPVQQMSNDICIEKPTKESDMDDSFFDMDFDMKDMLEWFGSQLNCKTLDSMKSYDIIKELEGLEKKFSTESLKNMFFADNDAIRELFGGPIDFKGIKKQDPKALISDFFSKLSCCNIATVLFEILKCLFGGFSLDEALEVIVKRMLYAGGIPAFKAVVWDLDPSSARKERVAACAAANLSGFDKTPWDYYDEKLKEVEDDDTQKYRYMLWLGGVDEKAKDFAFIRDRAGLGGGNNPPQPNVEEVFDQWLDCYIDALEDFDWILEQIKDFPGSEILKLAVATFGCPSQFMLKQFFSELKGILNFGALNCCNPLGEKFFNLPELPNLPKMDWKEILRALLMIIAKKIIDLISQLLLKFVMKLLSQLSCEGFVDFFKELADGLGNEDNLLEAIGESFCDTNENNDDDAAAAPAGGGGGPGPDGVEPPGFGNTPAMDTLAALMDEQGVSGPDADIMALSRDISACAGKNEFKKAFLNGPNQQDPDFCAMIANICSERHPRFAPVLGSPQQVGNFFSGIGNFLSPRQKELIGASIPVDAEDSPIDDSICLTKEQKTAWVAQKRKFINDLCGNLPMDGFRAGDFEPQTPVDVDGLTDDELDDLGGLGDDEPKEEPTLGDDWLDKLGERDTSNLDEALGMFLNGPAEGVAEALEEAFKLVAPTCNYDPETGEPLDPEEQADSGGMPPWPEELTSMVDEAKKDVLASIEGAFAIDLQGGYHSLFNHLLSDTYNHPYLVGSRFRPSHNTLVRMGIWWAPNAANTEAQWQTRWDAVKERRFSIRRFIMKRTAPDVKIDGTEIEDHTDETFPTHVYPSTVGIWMRNQLLGQVDPESEEPLSFATDMGTRWSSANVSVTPRRWNRNGDEVNNYRRRRWRLDKNVTYKFKRRARAKEEMLMKFRDNNNGLGGWQYGFNLRLINYTYDDDGNQLKEPAYRLVLDEYDSTNVANGSSWRVRAASINTDTGEIELSGGLPSRIRASRDTYMDLEIKTDPGRALTILPEYAEATDSELSKYNYPGIVFKNYVKSKYAAARANYDGGDKMLAQTVFDSLNNFVYSNVVKMVMNDPNDDDGIPETFKFGYVNDTLTRSDFTYVSPEAEGYSSSDPETWEYDHKNDEKILGHSATKNPRVEFLDPDIHGGKYTKPKIYVHPPKYKGWLGIKQMIVPEDDNHEPARKQFLFTDDIIKQEKDLREEIPIDERLNNPKKCQEERAYDLLNEPSGHAGIHSTVLLTTRVYAFEHLIRTMSLYGIMKIDFTNNYDESILSSIVKDMEEGLKATPDRGRRRGFFKGYKYWLLFLEQSVQTLERMIITDKIKMTPALAELFEDVKKIRDEVYVLNNQDIIWMKFVRQVSWDESGQISNIEYKYFRRKQGKRKYYSLSSVPTEEENRRVIHMLDGIMFHTFGRNFRSILAGETRLFAYRMRSRQKHFIKMCNKLWNIYNTRDVGEMALRYLVADQLQFYGTKLNEIANDTEISYSWRPQPYIDNLRKYFFGSSGTILTPLQGGLTDEENAYREIVAQAIKEEQPIPEFDYGNAAIHVQHAPAESNPVESLSSAGKTKLLESPEGNFYIEKYLRIIDKPEQRNIRTVRAAPNTREGVLKDRDPLLKGVVNIKEFQNWLKQNKAILNAPHGGHSHSTKVSDVFGDATPIYDPDVPSEMIGYEGSIGIKFGVRLCFVPPSSYKPDTTNGGTSEKSFKFKEAEGFPEHNTRHIFPVASYERDILDRDMSELNLNDDNFGEELNCYIAELMKSPEIDLIFNYCAPIKRAASMIAVYCNYAFIPSIGEDPSERDVINSSTPHNHWKGAILQRTKNRLRHLFVSNYRAVAWSTFVARDFNAREKARRSFTEMMQGDKKSRGSRVGGWRIGRRIVDRPYDMYGELEDESGIDD